MKHFLLTTAAGLLILCASRADDLTIPPNEGTKRDDWIFEHYKEIKTRQSELLSLPKDCPKEATRPIPPDLAAKIKIGTSFKIVLAMLGVPSEQNHQTGGSGPVELPSSYWTYILADGSKMRLEFQFNRTLSDVVVTSITGPKTKGPQPEKAD